MEEMERDVKMESEAETEPEIETDIVINYPSWIIVSAKGKLTVNEVEFYKMFLQNRELRCIGGQFRDMNGEVSEDEIKHEISKIITEHIVEGVSGKVKSVTETIKLRCYSEPPEVCEDEIHLLNGILKTDGMFTEEQRFCINRLNVEYDSSAPPPEKFIRFLGDLLEPDDIVTLQEYLGYLLIPSTKGQAMLSIIGNGGEGKSVLGTVVKEIFGSSMTEGSFRRIETDRFFRANLKGKLVFVDDDLQLEALPTTGYIKSLITIQIPTDIEYKGRQSFTEKLYARFLCFGNGTIKSLRDKSHGFSRRMIILSAKPVAPNRITNPNIAEEIISEKAGILNWLFDGLQRLIANNYQFTLSEKARLNAAEMSSDNCNIIEFLSAPNTVIYSESAEISSAVLYGVYSKWCDENALTATKRDVFTGWLKTNQHKYGIQYSSHIATANGSCVRGFKGIQTK
jgi:putative DNA primase/helicase